MALAPGEIASIPHSSRKRLGLLQCLFAGQDIGSQPAAWQIVEIKEFGFAAAYKADLIAAGLRHSFVPDDARHHSIIARDSPARVPAGR